MKRKILIGIIAAVVLIVIAVSAVLILQNRPEPEAPATEPTVPATTEPVPIIIDPPPQGETGCICGAGEGGQHLPGCDGMMLSTWRVWLDPATLPTSAGYYKLGADVTLAVCSSIAGIGDLYLDLNGHTLTGPSVGTPRVFNMIGGNGVNLTILDSSPDKSGKIVLTGRSDQMVQGNLAVISTKANTLTIYGGTIDGSGAIGNKTGNGGVIRAVQSANLYIHGGTVIAPPKLINGGIIFSEAKFVMTGGELKGGFVTGNGGNVFVNGGTFEMSGGAIRSGRANIGGNVYIANGSMTMTGGEITGGSGNSGRDLFYAEGAKFTAEGGTVSTQPTSGAGWQDWFGTTTLPTAKGSYRLAVDVNMQTFVNLASAGTIRLDLNGHTIRGPKSGTFRIFNLLDGKGATLTLMDSRGTGKILVSGADSKEFQASFALLSGSMNTLNIQGGTIDASGASGNNKGYGGLIRAVKGANVNISGGTIIGAPQCIDGGVLYVNGRLVITGGTVMGGKVSGNGGNIYLQDGTLRINGGTVQGGTAKQGGNIYVAKGLMHMTDGTVQGGSAESGMDVYISDDAQYHPLGGTVATPVRQTLAGKDGCICGTQTQEHLPGCDGTVITEWKLWPDANSLPKTAGYYRLSGDVTVAESTDISGIGSIFLDLNGFTVTVPESVTRAFTATKGSGAALTVLDSGDTGKIVINADENQLVQGGFILLNEAANTLTLYGGTVDASNAIGNGKNYGAVVRAVGGASVSIHGGTVIGTKAIDGGAIFMNGSLTMTGGTVLNGIASGNGGNICLQGGTFTMTGGEIKGGTAANGENVYVAPGASFTQTGGTVADTPAVPTEEGCICGSQTDTHLPGCDGTVQQWTLWESADTLPKAAGYYRLSGDVTVTESTDISSAGSIYLDLNGFTVTVPEKVTRAFTATKGSGAALTVLDSKDTGKIVINAGDDQLVQGSFILLNLPVNTLTVYGGTVDASNAIGNGKSYGAVVRAVGGASVSIHGGTVIGTRAIDGGTVFMNGTLTMTGGEIRGGTASGNGGNICLQGGTFTMTGGEIKGGTAANGENVYVASGASFTQDGGTITDTPVQPEAPDCICGAAAGEAHLPGCDGTAQQWTPTSVLPTSAGYYRLTEDVQLTGKIDIRSKGDIYLDLNGHTVTAYEGTGSTQPQVFNMAGGNGVRLTILDSSLEKTGRIVLTGNPSLASQGALTTISTEANSLTLYGGVIDGSGITSNAKGYGAVIRAVSGAQVNIHGGTIIGTKAIDGGTVFMNGTMTMTGGTVQDGTASGNGGNICLQGGTFTMTGGTVQGGTAANGENVYVAPGASFTQAGGTVADTAE